jgi:hypothetical protein
MWKHSEPGTKLTLVWGEEGRGSSKPTVERHVQAEMRVTVAPAPISDVARRVSAEVGRMSTAFPPPGEGWREAPGEGRNRRISSANKSGAYMTKPFATRRIQPSFFKDSSRFDLFSPVAAHRVRRRQVQQSIEVHGSKIYDELVDRNLSSKFQSEHAPIS